MSHSAEAYSIVCRICNGKLGNWRPPIFCNLGGTSIINLFEFSLIFFLLTFCNVFCLQYLIKPPKGTTLPFFKVWLNYLCKIISSFKVNEYLLVLVFQGLKRKPRFSTLIPIPSVIMFPLLSSQLQKILALSSVPKKHSVHSFNICISTYRIFM